MFFPGVYGGGGLSNGVIINDVANFLQTTKPFTRIDGSALVAGDRWYKPDEGTEWFWNGTYWLSSTQRIVSRFRQVTNDSNNAFPLYTSPWPDHMDVPLSRTLFVESVSYTVVLNSLGDADNYRRLILAQRRMQSGTLPFYTSTTKIYGSLSRIYVKDEPINMLYTPSDANETWGFTFNIAGVGATPPNGTNPGATLYFREVHP